MKATLFTILAFLLSAVAVNAQCTPDSLTYPRSKQSSYGLHPNNLPDAISQSVYSQTVQFLFPSDTVAFGTIIHINSVKVDSVIGLPYSFTYKCNNANCSYKGGDYGCVQITGNPQDAQIGTHNLTIYYTANTSFANVPNNSVIQFKIDANSGIFFQPANKIQAAPNFPNPFSANTEIQFVAPSPQSVNFKVSNELGQQVYTRSIGANTGLNTFNFERNNLPAGMYFYSIQMGNDIVTRRMVIKD